MGTTGPPANAFVSTWRTSNTSTGSSTSTQVKLPLVSGGTYNFTVEWGDGNTDVITAWNQAEVTHTYLSSGDYEIICTPNVVGGLTGFAFQNSGDRLKFLDVTQYGGLKLLPNQGGTFWGCANFTGASATDILDTVGVTSMTRMFSGATIYNQPITFNTSSVVTMGLMFAQANAYNQPLSFDTASVTDMSSMFNGAVAFNSTLTFNTASVTNMASMFEGASAFNKTLTFNTANVLNMSRMFANASSFNQALSFNTASVTNMNFMFLFCPYNQALSFNTASVTDMSSMFRGAAYNQALSFNTSSVLNMNLMFFASSFKQSIASFDVNQVTNFAGLFQAAGLPTANYDALLIAWAAQLPFSASARSVDFGTSKYTLANPAVVAARAALVAHFTTSFTDGGGI